MSTGARTPIDNVRIPELPWHLTARALLFVPGIYIVLLISLALVLGVGGGICYAIYYLVFKVVHFYIPFALVIVLPVGFGTVIGAAAVIGAFVNTVRRPRNRKPAILMPLSREKHLQALLKDLCEQLGADMPDALLLHALPELAATHVPVQTLNGIARGRVLMVGVPYLCALSVNELRALLAHEIAHFTGRDYVYSRLVAPVYLGALAALRGFGMADVAGASYDGGGGWVTLPVMIPRWMLGAYVWMFHKVNMRIYRMREERADVIAAVVCGAESFRSGLRKIHGIDGVFSDVILSEAWKEAGKGQFGRNFYADFRSRLLGLQPQIEEHEQKAYNWLGTSHDEHPPIRARLAYVPDIEEMYQNEEPASTLIPNLDQYEERLCAAFMVFAAGMQFSQ